MMLARWCCAAASLARVSSDCAESDRPRILADGVGCSTVSVGSGGGSSSKSVLLPAGGLLCSATPLNSQGQSFEDVFTASVCCDRVLTVTRSDSGGWGQDLELLCCPPLAQEYLGCWEEGVGMLSSPALGPVNSTQQCADFCAGHSNFALSHAGDAAGASSAWCSCGGSYALGPGRGLLDDSECQDCSLQWNASTSSTHCGGVGAWAVFQHGTSCLWPGDVAHIGAQPCAQGMTISHGESCVPQCAAGYAPSHAVLQCQAGELQPENPLAAFSCVEILNSCSAPEVAHDHPGGSCLNGIVAHGANCSTQCELDYAPDVEELVCDRGTLTPQSFTCLPIPCSAPRRIRYAYHTGSMMIEPATQTCREGEVIPHLGRCTAECEVGHLPELDNSSLECAGGRFSPPSWTCKADCRLDADCGLNGICVVDVHGRSLCRCDPFMPLGAAWKYVSLQFGSAGDGIMATDSRNDVGYVMYSEQNLTERFLDGAPPRDVAPHMLVVSQLEDSSGWVYDSNAGLLEFDPRGTDVLVATVDFASQTVSLLPERVGFEERGGIRSGFWRQRGLNLSFGGSNFSHEDECQQRQTLDVPDQARHASSSLGDDAQGQGTHRGRLDSTAAWTSGSVQPSWYVLDVGFHWTSEFRVVEVVLKGAADRDAWVTKLTIDWSLDGIEWSPVDPDPASLHSQRLFDGVGDRDTPATLVFDAAVQARYIRLNPEQHSGAIALRAGIVVCDGDPNVGELGFSDGAVVVVMDRCARPVLVDPPAESRSDGAESSPPEGSSEGMLESPSGWSGDEATAAADLWYQVDLRSTSLVDWGWQGISEVVLKGHGQRALWVTSFSLRVSSDGDAWMDVAGGRVFLGPADSNTSVNAHLGVPVDAQLLRVYPVTWEGQELGQPPALRLGLVLCGKPAGVLAAHKALYSGGFCEAPPGDEWALFNAVPLQQYWEVREVAFFGDVDCFEPLDISMPISSGAAFLERTKATRGPTEFLSRWAFDGRPYTSWVSSCAYPCETGGAFIGVRLSLPAAVRCVMLQQHGAPTRTATSVELRTRVHTLSDEWTPSMSWHGVMRTCSGRGCMLGRFMA